MKTVALLLNVGSPDSPSVRDVRRYLAQFLMDKYVIDLPWIMRALLVYGIILPTRPKRSAHAYQKIWTSSGSPLITISEKLTQKLRPLNRIPIEYAMGYGQPSIQSVLSRLNLGYQDRLLVIPMYPQYAESTTRSAIEGVKNALSKLKRPAPQVWVKTPFYNDPLFIRTWTDLVLSSTKPITDEHLLFSFHGLPIRHIKKADPTQRHCLSNPNCCEQNNPTHATCYRHQCRITAHAIATELGLSPQQWSIAFQSRLGKDEWLAPATDSELKRLAQSGIKRIRVLCPSFTTDCLETLEEINIGGKETFLSEGGSKFMSSPCPNDQTHWAQTITHWINQPEQYFTT